MLLNTKSPHTDTHTHIYMYNDRIRICRQSAKGLRVPIFFSSFSFIEIPNYQDCKAIFANWILIVVFMEKWILSSLFFGVIELCWEWSEAEIGVIVGHRFSLANVRRWKVFYKESHSFHLKRCSSQRLLNFIIFDILCGEVLYNIFEYEIFSFYSFVVQRQNFVRVE